MVEYKQDMPPPGGYAPITYKRVPLKSSWHYGIKTAAVFAIMGFGWVGYHIAKRNVGNEKIEMLCGKLALTPMMLAEVDRMLLKQLKKNRDTEEKIMKDVEGWELGKWRGEPVFLSIGPNDYFRPAAEEYYAHCNLKEAAFVRNILQDL